MKKSTLLTAILSFFLLPGFIFAQPDLGTLEDFVLFTAAGQFEVSPGIGTVATGDVGTNAGAFLGFPPGTLIGTKFEETEAPIPAMDVMDLYDELFMWPGICTVIGSTLGNGQTLTPGFYCIGEASTLVGDLVLDGDGLYIIQIKGGALATAAGSSVTLTGGAHCDSVFWLVEGAFSVGPGAVFRGTVVNVGAINLAFGSTLLGRALSTAGAINVSSFVNANVAICQDNTGTDIEPIDIDNIPTLGQWGLIILGLLFTVFAVVMIRKRAFTTVS